MLDRYVGKYNGSQHGTVDITRVDNAHFDRVGHKFVLHPESENVFFTTARDLTFEFLKQGTKASTMVVREHGAMAKELKAE